MPPISPLLLLLTASSAARELAYRIERVLEPDVHVIVHLDLDGDTDGTTELSVQERWGGVDAGGEDVAELRAVGADGTARTVERLAPHRWVVRHRGGERLSVAYRLDANEHQAATDPDTSRRPIVGRDLLHAYGHLFLVVPEHLDPEVPRPLTVEWLGFGEDAGLACSFGVGAGPHTARVRLPSGETRAASLHDLRHAVYLGGDLRLLRRDVAGRPVWVAAQDRGWGFDVGEFADLTPAIVEVERGFFGDFGRDFYLVSLVPVGQPRPGSRSLGGTGLTASFALQVQPGPTLEPGSEGYRSLVTLLAHEMFHEWNGTLLQRVQPEQLVYWFSEGFTDFYARRLLLRGGLIDVDEYVASLNRALRRLFTSPVREAPNSAILAGFWRDPDLKDLPYVRGDVVATLADHAIRRASGGERSLDDAMRDLMGRAAGGWRVSTAELLALLEREAGPGTAAALRAVVEDGALPVLDPETFAPCLALEVQELALFDAGFDVERSIAERVVRDVDPDGPAHAAGLREGWELRGWSIRRGATDEEVRFDVVVDGEPRSIRYLPVGGRVAVPQFVREPDAPEEACAVL